MDIIDLAKNIFKKAEQEQIIEGAPDAYDKVKALTDEQLEKYIGVDPVKVPREVQEELYLRFVQPFAYSQCNECHGRGHTGWIPQLHQVKPCICLQAKQKDKGGYLYDSNGNKINFNKN